jgi:plastocyanin
MRRCLLTLFCLAIAGASVGTAPTGVPDIRGLVRVGNKATAHAVVWIDGPRIRQDPQPAPVLDQRNLDFYPRVLAVQTGAVVEFPNHDRVFHNVFSFHNGKKFDLGLYPTGSTKRITFDRPGISRLFCNIHPHMAAYIMAVDSPYFAVSDDAGQFTIRGLPAGTYTYHAWRPGGIQITAAAAMNAQAPLEVQWP